MLASWVRWNRTPERRDAARHGVTSQDHRPRPRARSRRAPPGATACAEEPPGRVGRRRPACSGGVPEGGLGHGVAGDRRGGEDEAVAIVCRRGPIPILPLLASALASTHRRESTVALLGRC